MKNQILTDLQNGKVATVPTETVEGYAVALSSENGIKNLIKLKDRDYNSGKIFTLVPETKDSIPNYAIISPIAQKLINEYFPGELTLILPKNPNFKHFYYDHYNTIGVRIPNHDLFPLITKTVGPVLLTSANPKGGTPKSLTGHKPSTIIDLTKQKPVIIRQGNLIIDLNHDI